MANPEISKPIEGEQLESPKEAAEPKIEAEKTPEKIVDDAVAAVEKKEEKKPENSKTWEGFKDFIKMPAVATRGFLNGPTTIVSKIAIGLLKFAKYLVTGKGDPYQIGSEMFTYGGKSGQK